MTKLIALKGNLTTTGGRVLDGDATTLDDGQPLARHMGLASCPRCGQNGPIYGSALNWGMGASRGVRDGDIVMCRCPRGTNRVIARSSIYDGG
ncbi:PAAR domain-containing protein [Paraburkholderia terrae]|uniref:PAAR domain-containing protein n=1 Tax=Paraburkholderia terrae TaxID=311230 RepID=A0A2I8EX93_9BURK|nr:PAAR domain-containing protein [Paraburkholderia terrae]AUT64245.1 PAAR domain-containing protein [Paraburkholderia terrae]